MANRKERIMAEKQPILSEEELTLIEAAMLKRGFNQADLAEIISASEPRLSNYFTCIRSPPVAIRRSIATALKLGFREPTPARIIRKPKTKKASKRNE